MLIHQRVPEWQNRKLFILSSGDHNFTSWQCQKIRHALWVRGMANSLSPMNHSHSRQCWAHVSSCMWIRVGERFPPTVLCECVVGWLHLSQRSGMFGNKICRVVLNIKSVLWSLGGHLEFFYSGRDSWMQTVFRTPALKVLTRSLQQHFSAQEGFKYL